MTLKTTHQNRRKMTKSFTSRQILDYVNSPRQLQVQKYTTMHKFDTAAETLTDRAEPLVLLRPPLTITH